MICVLHSGGLDSTAVIQYYLNRGQQIQPMFVDYGQIAAATERKCSKKIANLFGINPPITVNINTIKKLLPKHPLISGVKLSRNDYWKNFSREFFPSRNILLLTVASIYCFGNGIDQIAIGIVGGSRKYPDTNSEFLGLVNDLLSDSVGIRVLGPLAYWDKQRVVSYLRKNKFNLEETFSCNLQVKTHCGKCASCIERRLAMA